MKGKESIDLLQDVEIVLEEFRKVISVINNEGGECKVLVESEEEKRRSERQLAKRDQAALEAKVE